MVGEQRSRGACLWARPRRWLLILEMMMAIELPWNLITPFFFDLSSCLNHRSRSIQISTSKS